MAEAKTKPTTESVNTYLENILDRQDRDDCFALVDLMKSVTDCIPKMWGPSIVGFGEYHYKYESGHQGEICLTGFSCRKQGISLYVLAGFNGQSELLRKLGKHKAGKGCLYIKRLADVDLDILVSLMRKSVDFLKKKYHY